MTIEEMLVKKLMGQGVSPRDAIAALETLKVDEPAMTGRWTHDTKGYPSQLLAALLYSAKSAAGLLDT